MLLPEKPPVNGTVCQATKTLLGVQQLEGSGGGWEWGREWQTRMEKGFTCGWGMTGDHLSTLFIGALLNLAQGPGFAMPVMQVRQFSPFSFPPVMCWSNCVTRLLLDTVKHSPFLRCSPLCAGIAILPKLDKKWRHIAWHSNNDGRQRAIRSIVWSSILLLLCNPMPSSCWQGLSRMICQHKSCLQ